MSRGFRVGYAVGRGFAAWARGFVPVHLLLALGAVPTYFLAEAFADVGFAAQGLILVAWSDVYVAGLQLGGVAASWELPDAAVLALAAAVSIRMMSMALVMRWAHRRAGHTIGRLRPVRIALLAAAAQAAPAAPFAVVMYLVRDATSEVTVAVLSIASMVVIGVYFARLRLALAVLALEGGGLAPALRRAWSFGRGRRRWLFAAIGLFLIALRTCVSLLVFALFESDVLLAAFAVQASLSGLSALIDGAAYELCREADEGPRAEQLAAVFT